MCVAALLYVLCHYSALTEGISIFLPDCYCNREIPLRQVECVYQIAAVVPNQIMRLISLLLTEGKRHEIAVVCQQSISWYMRLCDLLPHYKRRQLGEEESTTCYLWH